MYEDKIGELIKNAPTLSVLRVYYQLTTKEQFQGGIYTSKKAIADELGLSSSQATSAFKWLKNNGYITETRISGNTKFIINSDNQTNNKSIENDQPKQEIIKKGGKTITRMEIPD